MRIVIFGGAGFIGRNLALYMSKYGYEVIAFDRIDNPGFPNSIKYVKGNFSDITDIDKMLLEGDCVIHLSWNSVPADGITNIITCLNDDVIGSVHLFQLCVQKKISKIIFLSSGGAIYGTPQYLPIDEKHTTTPTSAYGINKLTVEKYLELITTATDTKAFIIRLANIFGPFQRPFTKQGVVSTFLASALLDKPINIWGDGSAVKDYIFIDDLSEMVRHIAEFNGESSVYNAGSGIGYSVNDIIAVIEETTGKQIEKTYTPSYTGDVVKNILDCTKALTQLRWKSEIPLKDGIEIMINCWNSKAQLFDNINY